MRRQPTSHDILETLPGNVAIAHRSGSSLCSYEDSGYYVVDLFTRECVSDTYTMRSWAVEFARAYVVAKAHSR